MKNANNRFDGFTGTESYHKHLLGNMLTDGAVHFADKMKAHWFIDIIVSYSRDRRARDEGFQVWKLKRVCAEKDKFIVTMEDGNDHVLITQKIQFSDFEDDEITLWKVNDVIMLPSEY